MWFKTGAARVGDDVCARVLPVVSGVGPKCVRAGHIADMGRLAVQWQGDSAVNQINWCFSTPHKQ